MALIIYGLISGSQDVTLVGRCFYPKMLNFSLFLAMTTKLVNHCRFCRDSFLSPSTLGWSSRLHFHATKKNEAKSMEEIQEDDIRADIEEKPKKRVAVSNN